MTFDLLDGRRIDHRANLDPGLCPRANFQRFDPRGQRGDEGVVNARLNRDPVGADAGLAAIAELRGHRAFNGGLQIGVVENDERRVAAQLEAQTLPGRGALRCLGKRRSVSSR